MSPVTKEPVRATSPDLDDGELRRRQLLARIEHDRLQLADTLEELRGPLQTAQRMQKNVRAIVPALLVAGAAFLILRAVRGSRKKLIELRPDGKVGGRSGYALVRAPRRTSWFSVVLQMVSVYRIALVAGDTMRSVSQAIEAIPRKPAPPARPAEIRTAVRPAAPGGRSHSPFDPLIEPGFERNPK